MTSLSSVPDNLKIHLAGNDGVEFSKALHKKYTTATGAVFKTQVATEMLIQLFHGANSEKELREKLGALQHLSKYEFNEVLAQLHHFLQDAELVAHNQPAIASLKAHFAAIQKLFSVPVEGSQAAIQRVQIFRNNLPKEMPRLHTISTTAAQATRSAAAHVGASAQTAAAAPLRAESPPPKGAAAQALSSFNRALAKEFVRLSPENNPKNLELYRKEFNRLVGEKQKVVNQMLNLDLHFNPDNLRLMVNPANPDEWSVETDSENLAAPIERIAVDALNEEQHDIAEQVYFFLAHDPYLEREEPCLEFLAGLSRDALFVLHKIGQEHQSGATAAAATAEANTEAHFSKLVQEVLDFKIGSSPTAPSVDLKSNTDSKNQESNRAPDGVTAAATTATGLHVETATQGDEAELAAFEELRITLERELGQTPRPQGPRLSEEAQLAEGPTPSVAFTPTVDSEASFPQASPPPLSANPASPSPFTNPASPSPSPPDALK